MRSRRSTRAFLSPLLVLGACSLLVNVASADACPPVPAGGCLGGTDCEVVIVICGDGDDGVGGSNGGSVARVAPRPAVDPHPPIVLRVATCTGNVPLGQEVLCTGATETCPDPVDTRFWEYVQTWMPAQNAYGPPVRRTDPPYVCLGPAAAAAVDPTIAIIATMRLDWKSFGLPAATVITQPGDQTLANAATRFSTTTPASGALPPRPVLGTPVTLAFQAVGYRWDFGDRAIMDVQANGAPAPRVEHTYREAGPKVVSLRTFYTATFTIEGSPTIYPLTGTAEVPGVPGQLAVREARTQLVDD